jgi:hypothetical protein
MKGRLSLSLCSHLANELGKQRGLPRFEKENGGRFSRRETSWEALLRGTVAGKTSADTEVRYHTMGQGRKDDIHTLPNATPKHGCELTTLDNNTRRRSFIDKASHMYTEYKNLSRSFIHPWPRDPPPE